MSKTFDEKKYQKNNQELVKYVIKYKAGDKSAFDYVYKYSEKYVYSVISKIVKSNSDVADVMQETYIKIYNQLDNLKTPETFLVWAGRIASNNTIDYMRKNNKEVLATEESEDFLFENASEDTEEFIPENVYLSNEKQSEIRQILDKLSDEQKLTIQLFYFEEYSVSEIAELTGVSTGTVKSRLNYARNSIKDYVKEVEEKKNIKLYSLSGLPLLLFFYGDINAVVVPTSVSFSVRKTLALNKSVSVKLAAASLTRVASIVAAIVILGGVVSGTYNKRKMNKSYQESKYSMSDEGGYDDESYDEDDDQPLDIDLANTGWVGTYMGTEQRGYRLDISEFDRETGEFSGVALVDDGDSGRYYVEGTYYKEDRFIDFKGQSWMANPENKEKFEWFSGEIALDGERMSGIVDDNYDNEFELIKSDYRDFSVKLNNIAGNYEGEYDGSTRRSGDLVVVRRNISINIVSMDDNGDIEGVVNVSPSNKNTGKMSRIYASYHYTGHINLSTGEIDLRGVKGGLISYKDVDDPDKDDDSWNYLRFNGYIDSKDYSINGTTKHGIWNMNATDVALSSDDVIGEYTGNHDDTLKNSRSSRPVHRASDILIEKCDSQGNISGIVEVYPIEYEDNQIRCSYTFEGSVNLETGEIEISGKDWIEEPEEGEFCANPDQTYTGRIQKQLSGHLTITGETGNGYFSYDKKDKEMEIGATTEASTE